MKTSKLLEVHVTDDGRAFAVFEKKTETHRNRGSNDSDYSLSRRRGSTVKSIEDFPANVE